MVNQLADNSSSSAPSPARQSTLDSHIRSRIQDELSRLRQEEEAIKHEIELALEKENLDKERQLAGEDSQSEEDTASAGGVKSSATLIGDLEDLQHKVDRYQKRRDDSDVSEVQTRSQAVVDCYRCVLLYIHNTRVMMCFHSSNPSTPLDCWKEVSGFKLSVAKVEQVSTC